MKTIALDLSSTSFIFSSPPEFILLSFIQTICLFTVISVKIISLTAFYHLWLKTSPLQRSSAFSFCLLSFQYSSVYLTDSSFLSCCSFPQPLSLTSSLLSCIYPAVLFSHCLLSHSPLPCIYVSLSHPHNLLLSCCLYKSIFLLVFLFTSFFSISLSLSPVIPSCSS